MHVIIASPIVFCDMDNGRKIVGVYGCGRLGGGLGVVVGWVGTKGMGRGCGGSEYRILKDCLHTAYVHTGQDRTLGCIYRVEDVYMCVCACRTHLYMSFNLYFPITYRKRV